ncbi:MAG TPA: 16S rRNA (cytosine(1402)-N(4))-methyltransferase RsmH [Gammaproteobacteria bacterium]|nr:16S rRNA (cytosine(1402)-N(4))-methyltransferase RsmH [Gammaproteobacteria bacterium]
MAGHQPVLLDEALEALRIRGDGAYLDATFGRGGHSAGILQRLNAAGRLLALDRDPEAVAEARRRFGGDARFTIAQGSFGRLREVAAEAGFERRFDGLLLDLGVSSPQLEDPARGFSFLRDGPLDMRMDPGAGMPATEWLAHVPERKLAGVIRRLGEERFARRIARAIVTARSRSPITRTLELARLVADAVPVREPGQHPATRTFQAIRIFINRELEELESGLTEALHLLAPAGRVCVIAFHSLEDRIVKRFFRDQARVAPAWAGLPDIPAQARPRLERPPRPVRPSAAEIARNPRARSAVLRVAQRVQGDVVP